MTLLGAFLKWDLPQLARRTVLKRLLRLTAEAFGSASPDVRGLNTEAILRTYACFTRDEVSRLGQDPARIAGVQERLYRSSSAMASTLGRLLGVSHWEAALAVSRKFYSYIGIDMVSTPRGEITFRSCYFSRFYSHETCKVMSALDSGMIAGLAGEGDLTFSCRITEGAPCCRACFRYRRTER
ncbi:MAG TPA: hypothetical protein VL126_06955 [Bacteroidota bacterium]|nr:hypothetical protein [Bacteroidota bacterium]